MRHRRRFGSGVRTIAGVAACLLLVACATDRATADNASTSAAPAPSSSGGPASSTAPVPSPSESVSLEPQPPASVVAQTPGSGVVTAPRVEVPDSVPPGGLVTEADMAAAAAAVAGMSTADRAAMVVMASSADAVGTDLVARLHLGGVILMGSDVVDGTTAGTPDQVSAVTAELQSQVPVAQAGAPLLIGTDQESGLVTRMVNGFTDFPGAQELGGVDDLDAAVAATQAVTAASGAELRAVGVNVDFAPDADVLPTSGGSGVAGRTFGPDPERNAQLVAAAVRGYQSGGVAATVKHFPGIGRLATDTHKALPSLDVDCDEWNAFEAVPMRAGVEAGTALVMTGHIELPAAGAVGQSTALSKAVVTDLLKGPGVAGCTGLNFRGVAVSDSFQMAPVADNFSSAEAGWRGIAAGQDLVLMPVNVQAAVSGIAAAVDRGQLSADRLADAATRVYALRLALGRIPAPGLEVVDSAEHQAVAAAARSAAG